MQKTAMSAEDRPPVSAAWREALRLFDADLRRRGMAEGTRRAYGVDLGQFALWATEQGLEPPAVTPRALRRYAALLSDRRNVAATVARKLAALRAFYRVLREHGHVAQNPADLMPAPKRPASLPKVLRPDEVAALLDRIPASTPLEVRDRALFELAYACGLRAEELVDLDVASVDFDAEELRVEGKGSKTRVVPAGEAALRAVGRYLRARAPGAGGRAAGRTRSSSRSPAAGSRRPTSGAACGSGRATPRSTAASPRTPCATPSRPTCSTAAPTSGPSRSCSATPRSPRPRSTLG